MAKPGILAPVGGQEQLIAAVRCGADAVYLGPKGFNARRNASNFDDDALREAARYCRIRGVKLYVTVNTMVLDGELPALEETAESIAAAGADGVILQDMAAAELFSRRYPHIHRVASTQTAVHDTDGARFLEDAGFQSFVLARELSLSEMERILSAVDIPGEAFVHGAHCMCMSGMCFLSSMLGGRSGNRGLCAQPCRLDWRCGGGDHVLSLKDMSLMEHIRALGEAGVATLKIEGRMKRPEYVAAAVTACRQARDGESWDADALRAVFSRSGFTDGYLTGKRDGDMFGCRTREDVTDAAPALKPLRELYRRERQNVPVDMRLLVTEETATLAVTDGTNTVNIPGPRPEVALTRPLDQERAESALAKTGGTPYMVRTVETEIEPGLTLPASALNAMRRQGLEMLDEARGAVPAWTRGTYAPASVSHRRVPGPSPLWARFYRGSQIPETDSLERVILPLGEITPALITALGDKLTGELPAVCFPEDEADLEARVRALREQGLGELWTENIYGIALARRLGMRVRGGFGLNIANTRAAAFYEARGLESLTVSFELPMSAVKALGGAIPRGIAAYGSLPLMRFRNCPVRANQGCAVCGGRGELTDRKGVRFPVECGERRYASLLNSVPLDIAGRDDPADFRLLWFTRESAPACAGVIERFRRGEKSDGPHTGGLYYRKLL